jgi:hypothetical protein
MTGSATIRLELTSERYITGCNMLADAEGVDAFRVYVTNDKLQKGNVIIEGNGRKGTYEALQWDNGFTVQRGKKGRHVIIEIDKTASLSASIPEVEFLFGD